MIRMSKDKEMGKKRKEDVPEGSQVKVNLNKTPRIPDYNMIVNCIGIGVNEEKFIIDRDSEDWNQSSTSFLVCYSIFSFVSILCSIIEMIFNKLHIEVF